MLTDLPDELLLVIIDHLDPFLPMRMRRPFDQWSRDCLRADAHHAWVGRQQLMPLSLVNRKFHALVVGQLDRNMVWSFPSPEGDSERGPRYLQLKITHDFSRIRHAFFGNAAAYSVNDIWTIFMLPSIRSLTLSGLGDLRWQEEDTYLSISKSSTVTCLNLLDCGLSPQVIGGFLSLSSNLQELSIEISQEAWREEPDYWSNLEFTMALEHVANKLTRLILFRSITMDSDGFDVPLGPGYTEECVDFRMFSKLPCLHVAHAFLVNIYTDDANMYHRLPPSLESLEIIYDDDEGWDLLDDGYNSFTYAASPLLTLPVLGPSSSVPQLKRVRISSTQVHCFCDGPGCDNGSGPCGSDHADSDIDSCFDGVECLELPKWIKPEEFVKTYKAANISFEICSGDLTLLRWISPDDPVGFRDMS